jgi:FixJ family two-component response regulator
MPVLDGWETHKKIIESGSKRPVIFISAEKLDNVADRALNAGAVGFLQKPFDCLALVNLINASENTCGVAQ